MHADVQAHRWMGAVRCEGFNRALGIFGGLRIFEVALDVHASRATVLDQRV